MSKFIILIQPLLLLLYGCQSVTADYRTFEVETDTEIIPYALYFINNLPEGMLEAEDYSHIKLAEPRYMRRKGSNIIGLCVHKRDLILINKVWWNQADFQERVTLIAHEMLHCNYKIGHYQFTLMDKYF